MNENYDIYVMNSDGTGITRLTETSGEEGWPEWSPDGKQIAFVSSGYQGEDKGDYDIFVLDLATDEIRNITDDPATDYSPSWSPDGSTLAFYSTYRSCTEPCDSSQADVYTIPIEGGEPTLLTGPEFDDVNPEWSPDGTRIFLSRAACCQFDLWSMEPDGTNRVRHTRTRKLDEGNVSFSSDPDRFVFSRSRRGNSSIWMMDLGSGRETRLSPRGREAGTPDWL